MLACVGTGRWRVTFIAYSQTCVTAEWPARCMIEEPSHKGQVVGKSALASKCCKWFASVLQWFAVAPFENGLPAAGCLRVLAHSLPSSSSLESRWFAPWMACSVGEGSWRRCTGRAGLQCSASALALSDAHYHEVSRLYASLMPPWVRSCVRSAAWQHPANIC